MCCANHDRSSEKDTFDVITKNNRLLSFKKKKNTTRFHVFTFSLVIKYALTIFIMFL